MVTWLCRRALRGSCRGCLSPLLLAMAAIAVLSLLLMLHETHELHARRTQWESMVSEEEELAEWRERLAEERSATGQRCVHPRLSPYHPSVWQPEDGNVPPVNCSAAMDDWVFTQGGNFRISPKAVKQYGKITCEYAPIVRGSDFNARHAPHVKPMLDDTPLHSDFFKVACVSASGKRYINIHAGVAFDPSVHERLSRYAEEVRRVEDLYRNVSSLRHSLQPSTTKKLSPPKPQNVADSTAAFTPPSVPASLHGLNLSVFMFGFDSLSRMAWMRFLPKTREYFMNRLSGIELEGYNIVGDGTPAALLPILTGKMEEELPEARRGFPGAQPVDGHPWLWKEFSQRGYVTAHAEDMAFIGTFQMRMLGFKTQPTDHNFRTFSLAAERMYRHYPPLCLGSQPRHVNFMRWFTELFDMYRPYPKFFFGFHSEMSHDKNKPVQALDGDLRQFLQDLEKRGHLNNTLLILMGDHGARFDYVRVTKQGTQEERLPYFAFRFPPWFQLQYPDIVRNVKTNAKRLSTPFDIHETLMDVSQFTGTGVADISQRGVSLFKEVPKERTCTQAEITPHWCACLEWVSINQSDASVQRAVKAAVDKINDLTNENRDQCAELSVAKITSSDRFTPSKQDLMAERKVIKYWENQTDHGYRPTYTHVKHLYQVSFITQPGGGHFEVTCFLQESGDFVINEKEMSRINKYGHDSDCISSSTPHLRSYCYCPNVS